MTMEKIYLGRYSHPIVCNDLFYVCSISLGRPKFKLDYVVDDFVALAAPDSATLAGFKGGDNRDFWIARYVAQLDQAEEVLTRELDRLLRRAKSLQKDLLFLCFENVEAGEFCHRSIFASWASARRAVEFVELRDRKSA